MPTITLPSFERPGRLPKPQGRGRNWFRIENAKADDETNIYIYDEIGYWGTSAQDFVTDLQGVKAGRINLHLNTPGGDVFDGIAILNALRQHSAAVTVYVDSLAASAGSVIAMAGEKIIMARASMLMIHEPSSLAFGDAAEMRKIAEVLDQIGDTIAGVYADRAGGSVREWRDRMLEETWYSDREAVEAGLADEVDGDPAVENVFDLSHFRHPPERLAAAARAPAAGLPTKRNIEKALRDAGLSRAQAKTFVSAAYGTVDLDEEARDAAELVILRDAVQFLLSGGA